MITLMVKRHTKMCKYYKKQLFYIIWIVLHLFVGIIILYYIYYVIIFSLST